MPSAIAVSATFNQFSPGIGVDAHPDRDEIQQRWQGCGGHNAGVGNAGKLDHDKGTGTYQGWHDLPAGGGYGLDRGGKALGIAKLRHRGQGDRAGGGDIRRGRARDGAEQG